MSSIRHRSCLAVIPARGGSKGIPNKNLKMVNGKPLVAYAIESVRDSGVDADIAISSDSEEILSIARSYNGVYALRRPGSISGDGASTEAALLNALEQMNERYGFIYEAVMTVQPTSPLRKSSTVADCWDTFIANSEEYDALLTLTETRTDYWVCSDGRFERLFPDASRRRQERKPLFAENSCLYITKADVLREEESVLGTRAWGFVIGDREGLDINEPFDLTMAEMLLSQGDL